MQTLTVVIIEDEEAHFSLMKRAIARELEYASVYHFQEANTFLERLDQINPTVIITDYLRKDGLEVIMETYGIPFEKQKNESKKAHINH